MEKSNDLDLKLNQRLQEVLKAYYGHHEFRGPQEDIINASLDGRDVFVCMATGSGKSLCYQIPPLIKKKTAIVVSPLISLMQDQVTKLNDFGIKACYLGSAQKDPTIFPSAMAGEYDIVYLTPELAVTAMSSLASLEKEKGISLLAIDESHCVSEWGHDFRPEYRRLGEVRERLRRTPCMALTASATPQVQDDIIKQLHLGFNDKRGAAVFKTTFNRPNLFYEIKRKGESSVMQLADKVAAALNQYPNGSIVVYCTTIAETDTVSNFLANRGFSVGAYHSKRSQTDREDVLRKFMLDEYKIVVATVAFGMGIDKPDIRLIVHYGIPKTIEAYYQQSGRAGRDGEDAHCLLLYNDADLLMKNNFYLEGIQNPEARQVRHILSEVDESCCGSLPLT